MSDALLYRIEAQDPFVLTPAQRRRLLRDAPWSRFAVLGGGGADSRIEAVDGYQVRSWSDRLADELRRNRPGFAQVNLGRRGLLAAQLRATQLEPAMQFKPDLATVLAGSHDIQQASFDIDAVEIELSRSISALRGIDCTVVMMGLFNGTGGPLGERMALVGDRIRVVSARLGAIYVDLSSHPAGRAAVGPDCLEFNARGHAIAESEAIRRLGRHLGHDVPS